MTLNNQKEYWDKVADIKIFTHPLDFGVIAAHFKKNHKILDYGCGYGRLTNEFYLNGFTDIIGVDTSLELIKRGKTFFPILSLNHIDRTQDLSNLDIKFDAVLLFAVLTCIASNSGQKELINTLRNRLKDGGLIYISDYYLQATTDEVKKYTFLGDDLNNYGIFTNLMIRGGQ